MTRVTDVTLRMLHCIVFSTPHKTTKQFVLISDKFLNNCRTHASTQKQYPPLFKNKQKMQQ